MDINYSTMNIALPDRNEYWRQVVCRTFVELDVIQRRTTGFQGSVRTCSFGELRATRITCDPMAATRTSDMIGRSSGDRFLIAVQLRGRTVGTQDGRVADLRPGDFALFDSNRPYSVDFQGSAFDHLVFHMPQECLTRVGIQGEHATAQRVPGDSGRGRLAASFLINLSRLNNPQSTAERATLARVAFDLLSSSLPRRRQANEPLSAAELADRAKAYARTRLHDPNLSPQVTADALSVSVRQLHRAFEPQDKTFNAWVREERLVACFNDLGNHDHHQPTIQDIRSRYGFRDPAIFSRSFKARFGMTPSERRESVTVGR
uniref:HTH araC/xylS-type domain-containing protein n=1 Tax=Rhodococcus sp. NS1 TaxID=402236 RepID=A0A097SQL8_9NOCA|nr:hypothetical protein LRS1606.392 [Rhodococcus sp. NS1]